MSIITARKRSLALSILISLSLTACLGGGSKTSAPPPVAGPAPAPAPTPTPPPDPVGAANHAPTISGTPRTSAKVNEPYVFQPTAADADGDKISFSGINIPAWATFDPKTGKLAGTPSSSSTGKFSGVTIVASDGASTSQLKPFDITVAAPAPVTDSATLSWQPPTENADGSPLVNLAGYVIRYGTQSDALKQEVRIGSPAITSATIESLTQATWYFTVSAVTTAGVESAPSTVASKTVS